MRLDLTRRGIAAAVPFVIAAEPASAHHLMGGKTPSTFIEGLLSGLGHPVIGPDHLAFLLAIGMVVGASGLNLLLPVIFLAAMALGVALHVGSANLPAAEVAVAASVLVAGMLVARGRSLPIPLWATLFAVAGIFHGCAYGESIFGAERSPLAAYLLGLVAIQSVLMVSVALVARRAGSSMSAVGARLAGAAIGGAGVTILMVQLTPPG